MSRRMRFGASLTAAVVAAQTAAAQTAGSRTETNYQIVAELETPPGNIAAINKRLYVSTHQLFGRGETVLRTAPTDRSPVNIDLNAIAGFDVDIDAVLGLQALPMGEGEGFTLYLLDNANNTADATPKLVILELALPETTGRIVNIPEPAPESSFHNDLAVHPDGRYVFTADFGTPAIGVIDLETGVVRSVLAGHESVRAEDNAAIVIDGRKLRLNGERTRIGVNPITIDHEGKWVYYGAMHGTSLYRVKAADLIDTDLAPEQLARRVDRFGEKPVSDGISIDVAGNVYITDLEAGGIGVTRPDGTYELLFADPDVIKWPDSITAGADGHFYFVINQLYLAPPFNNGTDGSRPPYLIGRFRGLAPGRVGR